MAFSSSESVTEAVLKALADHLETELTELSDVIDGFPESNVQLSYPALSIIDTGSTDYRPEMSPYPYNDIEEGDIADHSAEVKYVIGQHNFNIQLDLWCRSKEERDDLFESFMKAFNSQFPRLGLNLVLTDYHGIYCSYSMNGYSTEDAEISSQRQEWRVKINILANCKAILGKEEFIIEDTSVTGDIQDTSQPI